MAEYEYMRLPYDLIPPHIKILYNLHRKAVNGYVHIEIRKGMYRLKQAVLLAHTQLKKHLSQYGFHPMRHTPGLWTHDSRPISFTLIVDDFGIKYTRKADAEYLLMAIQSKYSITMDWQATMFCVITL